MMKSDKNNNNNSNESNDDVNDGRKRKREAVVESIAKTVVEGSTFSDFLPENARELLVASLDDGMSEEEIKKDAEAKLNEIIKNRMEKIREENKMMEKKIKMLNRRTLGRLMDLHDESKNDDGLISQRSEFRLSKQIGASNSSHTRTGHTEAEGVQKDFQVDPITYTQREEEEGESVRLESATILSYKNWPLRYTNEADVQKFVGAVLDDAVKYVNWALKQKHQDSETTLMARLETSMFSNKPDHLVVYALTPFLLPVLNVEVKKENKDVFTSKTVNGQILDYIMVSKMAHGKHTYGVITTFNESRVVWMEDSECDSVANTSSRLSRKKLDGVAARVAEAAPNLLSTPKMSPKGNIPKSETPPTLLNEAVIKRGRNGQTSSRSLRHSDLYKPHQLFTVFCNAIFASLDMGLTKAVISADFETNRVLEEGDTVLRLLSRTPQNQNNKRSKGHEWLTLKTRIELKGPWKNFSKKQQELYVVRYLGTGATSRVWQAVVKGEGGVGYACVVKYWIKVYDEERKETLDAWEIESQSSKATQNEVENYKRIYSHEEWPDLCRAVGRLKLNSRWCVILPLFKPIPEKDPKKEEGQAQLTGKRDAKALEDPEKEKGQSQLKWKRDEKALEEIENVLRNNFYKNGTSYQFRVCDRLWRHVGEWDGRIVLFDLADLDVKEEVSRDEHEKYVEEHIETLKEKLRRP